MTKSFAVMVAAALLLAGCGDMPIKQGAQIDLGLLEVVGGEQAFRALVEDRLDVINSGEGSKTLLELDEQRLSSISTLNPDGSAAGLQLRYTLHYRLEREGRELQENSFTFSRSIINDDTAHLASIARREHFFSNAQKDAIDNLVAELRFLTLP